MLNFYIRKITLLMILFMIFTYCNNTVEGVDTDDNNSIEKQYAELIESAVDNKAKTRLIDFLKGGVEKDVVFDDGVTADMLINTAEKYLGIKNVLGKADLSGMDCSGLVMKVLSEYNFNVPHSSEAQARYGKIIVGQDKLRRGDLIFFIRTYNTKKFITHVGIYIGDYQMIHSSSKRGVSVSSTVNSYWKPKFIFGTRIL